MIVQHLVILVLGSCFGVDIIYLLLGITYFGITVIEDLLELEYIIELVEAACGIAGSVILAPELAALGEITYSSVTSEGADRNNTAVP